MISLLTRFVNPLEESAGIKGHLLVRYPAYISKYVSPIFVVVFTSSLYKLRATHVYVFWSEGLG